MSYRQIFLQHSSYDFLVKIPFILSLVDTTRVIASKIATELGKYVPRHEKTGFLHLRKQRRRSVLR